MIVRTIALENFRNYELELIDFSENVNVITGENAQGKTNLLEAVYLLTGNKSWRTRYDRELIKIGCPFGSVKGWVYAQDREQKLEMLFRSGQRRKITKNGVTRSATELMGTVNAVLFSPEDLDIVREGAACRRKFMDAALSQLRPKYAELLSRYNKLWEHKSACLKQLRDYPDMPAPLSEINDQMCALDAQLIRYRASFVRRIAEKAGEIHSDFSGGRETLELQYKTVSTVTDPLAPAQEIYEQVLQHQQNHLRAEMDSLSCLTGIHKDDIEISINSLPARQFASQGQARTAALSLKMAERLLFLEETGEPPILLLDDVLSELDEKRQEFVLNRIGGGQTFITCCEGADIAHRTGGKVITIDGGRRI